MEIFADIRDRVPDALVGYSEENEAEYQKKIRELENSNEPEEDDSMLDRLPEGTGTGNQITGDWQEGEDILPADWDPNAILDNTETSSATSDGTVSASDTVDHKETSDENSSTGDRK